MVPKARAAGQGTENRLDSITLITKRSQNHTIGPSKIQDEDADV